MMRNRYQQILIPHKNNYKIQSCDTVRNVHKENLKLEIYVIILFDRNLMCATIIVTGKYVIST